MIKASGAARARSLIQVKSTADEFLVHANEEQGHADQIADRIVQLGGEPDFSPDSLMSRSHAEYVEGESLEDLPSGLKKKQRVNFRR
jgi:bacterioferritin (cytochrome b1)